MADPVMDRLAELPAADPDAVRSQRTRDLCRATLTRRAPSARAAGPRRRRPALWRPAVTVLGALYLFQALLLALRVYATR